MAEVIELCGSGEITDETLVYTDDIEMDGWMPFGEVKQSLDWEDGEEAAAFTSLYYQITEDEQSDECDMREVMRLINDGVITDETLVWSEGLDGWVPFEEAKYYCEWPDEEAGSGGPPETVYYETAPDESEELPFDDFKLLVEGGMVNDDTKIWAEGLSGVRAHATHTMFCRANCTLKKSSCCWMQWMPLREAKAAIGLGDTGTVEEGEPDEEATAAAAAEAELTEAMAADDSATTADAKAQLEAALAGTFSNDSSTSLMISHVLDLCRIWNADQPHY